MTSAIRFKFKSDKTYDTITFDGNLIKVADLKIRIVERRNLNFGEGFDLNIKNAQTGQEYYDESQLIEKNASLEVRRVHGVKANGILSKIAMARKNERFAERSGKFSDKSQVKAAPMPSFGPTTVAGQDESARIASLVQQQYMTEQAGNRGTNAKHPNRPPVPGPNYICHRCNRPGHWIDLCPTNGDPRYDRYRRGGRGMGAGMNVANRGPGIGTSSRPFVAPQPNEEEFARQTMALRMSMEAAKKNANSSQ